MIGATPVDTDVLIYVITICFVIRDLATAQVEKPTPCESSRGVLE